MDKVDLREPFFTAVGKCLHAWGFVELEVANLYMILHGVERNAYRHPIRAAFEAVISLEIRLAMIMAYVDADERLESYRIHAKSICSKIKERYKKRHEVAHFLIGAERVGSGLKYELMPFVTMYGLSQKRINRLTLEQLKERQQSFNELSDRVRQHVQHVGALLGLPTEFYASEGERAFPSLGS